LRVLERLFREAAGDDGAGGVHHAIGSEVGGILEDQVHLANASIDAYETTGSETWLTRAINLGEHSWRQYADGDGGLLDIPRERSGEGFLKQRIKPVQDSPTPSPNGVGGIIAARLFEHTGDRVWRERLERLLVAFAGGVVQLSIHGATLLRAIDWYLNPAVHIAIVGDFTQPVVAAMHRAARSSYRPRKVITLLGAKGPRPGLPEPLQAMINGEAPRAYVCAGPQCGPPASTAEQLVETLATLGRE
jgi:uncharacterized protein YyaL (SSP411 family)